MRPSKVLALTVLICYPLLSVAHHSTSSIYDEEQTLELVGTVKEWRFINPHPSLIIEIRDEDGSKQEWDISYGGAAVTHLSRRGYRADTFKPGDELVVRGHPARLEGAYGLLIAGEDPVRTDGALIP